MQAQNDKLITENSHMKEELNLMKKESAHSALNDTQKSDLRDKYSALLNENKLLKG